MVACTYGISLVINLISHSFATLTREIYSFTPEEKFHIYVRPCIIMRVYTLVTPCMTSVL